MNEEELIGKLQMVYVGDKNALNEMIDYYDELFDEMVNWRKESKELNQKYLNAVADYETTMFEKEQLNSLVNSCQEEIRELKKQLEYLRSREYYNQLRFERDMLQYVADNGKVSQEDKEFIDMTHRNTELLEVIEEVKRVLKCNNIEVLKYYDEPSETGSYEIVTVDLLQILDKAKDSDE